MNNKLIAVFSAIVILGLAAGIFAFAGGDEAEEPGQKTGQAEQVEQADENDAGDETDSSMEGQGILTAYSQQALTNSDAETNLIFFHAEWCTVCNSVERALETAPIPEGMAIFQVDYDSGVGQALAEKYNIPIQYSVVQVDTAGNEITKWVNNYNDGADEFLERIET